MARAHIPIQEPRPGGPARADICRPGTGPPEERVPSGHERLSQGLLLALRPQLETPPLSPHKLQAFLEKGAFYPETWAQRHPLIGGLSILTRSPRERKRASLARTSNKEQNLLTPQCRPENGQSWEKVGKAGSATTGMLYN